MQRSMLVGVLLSALAMAPAAQAGQVCSYNVRFVIGTFCPVHPGDQVCLQQTAAIGPCQENVMCYGGHGFFCQAQLQPMSGPEPKCPFGSIRPTAMSCYRPIKPGQLRTPTATGIPEPPTHTPTVTKVPTGSRTATASRTLTGTPTEEATTTATLSPTDTAIATPTGTATATLTAAATASVTSLPTATATLIAGATSTATPPSTATRTTTAGATNTATPQSTATGAATNTATSLSTATRTNTAGATSTATPQSTATGAATNTATSLSTATRTNTVGATSTATPPSTATRTNTAGATGTATSLSTATSTNTVGATSTATPPSTATRTNTAGATSTATPPSTATSTNTVGATSTVTPPSTATRTNTVGATSTATSLSTATSTNTVVGATSTVTPLSTATRTNTAGATSTATQAATATRTNTVGATSTATTTATSTPAAIGEAVCTLKSGSELLLQTQALPLTLTPTGSFSIDCGAPGPGGTAACACQLNQFGAVVIPAIGDVCVNPATGCAPGLVDCDGGSPIDVNLNANHDIGACTSNAACATACDAHCASLGAGFARQSFGCEGHCQGGSNDAGACSRDSECPGGQCPGGEPVGHADTCNCVCAGANLGDPARAGGLFCNLGTQINVELPSTGACGDQVATIQLAPVCGGVTTETSTGVVNNANNTPGTTIPATGPESVDGVNLTCDALKAKTITGLTLRGQLGFFDSTLGDIRSRNTFVCQ